jgi:hypothetical protein
MKLQTKLKTSTLVVEGAEVQGVVIVLAVGLAIDKVIIVAIDDDTIGWPSVTDKGIANRAR